MLKNKITCLHYVAFLVITVITIFLSHHIMVLLHEWAHGTAAWILGYKDSPFDIYYGDWTLFSVSEDVNYTKILAAGNGLHVSVIAGSVLLANMILFLMSLYILTIHWLEERKWAYQFVFWFAIMNVAQSFGYIPIRAFTTGDVNNVLRGTGWSPWVMFFPGTLFALWGIWRMFVKELPKLYKIISLDNVWMKRLFLLLVVLVVFGFYGVFIGTLKKQTFMIVCSVIAGIFTLRSCSVEG